MSIKEKDNTHLFISVKFFNSKRNSDRVVVYFRKNNKKEVPELLDCSKFQNLIQIIEINISRQNIFKVLLVNEIESTDDQNYK